MKDIENKDEEIEELKKDRLELLDVCIRVNNAIKFVIARDGTNWDLDYINKQLEQVIKDKK